VEKTVLLGTSVSTLIARDFTVKYPERVSALILVGPSFSAFGSTRRELLAKSWLKTLELGGPTELFAHIYPQVFGDKAIQDGGAPGYLALKERFLALNAPRQLRNNLSASLGTKDDPTLIDRLNCPVLLVAGDGDFLASRSSMEEIARRLREATVDVIPFAGHVPFFDEPDLFQDAIERFLLALDAKVAP
jgi:pimeloyl-ACP methyl ester carboxylesterase